jgi:hypothetical protein
MPIGIRGTGSATAGACRASFDSFQSGKEKCRPLGGRHFSKLKMVCLSLTESRSLVIAEGLGSFLWDWYYEQDGSLQGLGT